MISTLKGRGAINRIGVVNENSLHAALKELYRAPGSQCEVKIGNYIVDIVRDDLLIEIQTSNFGSIRRKLAKLLEHKRLRLVYPLASEKIIIVYDKEGEYVRYQRKSPKKNTFYDIVRPVNVGFPTKSRVSLSIDYPRYSCEMNYLLAIQR